MSTEVHNGVRNWYGSRSTEDKLPAMIKTEGYEKTMVIDFNYDDLPTESADGSMVIAIPADSMITSAKIHVQTAFSSGTPATDNLHFGLYQSDGTVIDADGIDAGVTVATLAEDAWIECDGALVGAGIGAADGQVRVAVVAGTLTAGTARLIVNYIQPLS